MELDVDELAARYQLAYPEFLPIQLTTRDLQPRFAAPVPASELIQPILNVGESASSDSATLLQARPDSTDNLGSLTATLARQLCTSHQLSNVASPEQVTTWLYVDERLHRLQIDYWTSVPIDNKFAATVISCYLKVDHPFYPLFDADLFLQNLVDREVSFCSPFLVISILSQACVGCYP